MASEQFSLCWDNFHKNMSSGLNALLENEDLVDVTLAVEGKFFKAHQMVLSVCSPYFKELFKTNPCQHPIVFLKDVSYVAISDLLQFMYQGEVQVSQDNLTTFIKTAEALQIKGLTGDGNGTDADSEPTQDKPVERQVEETYKPMPRPKKAHPAPIVTTTPAVKKPRLSLSSNDQPAPAPVTKTEPTIEPSQFKVEPFDPSQSVTIPDDGDETFGDDTLDDTTVDDNEDYSMMEGEEPQAGTSTDGAGEGQEIATIYIEKPKPGRHPKLIVKNNFYARHRTQRAKTDATIRWRCTNAFKTKCRSALYTTLQEDAPVKLFYEHNHKNNADNWDHLKMIPKTFLIVNFKNLECKPGPKVEEKVKEELPKKKRYYKKKKPVIGNLTPKNGYLKPENGNLKPENGNLTQENQFSTPESIFEIPIAGQDQPISVQILDNNYSSQELNKLN